MSDPGHGGIRTPIAFIYVTKWEEDPSVIPKMELIWLTLPEAKQLCFNRFNNFPASHIEDTSSGFAIFNAEYLISKGDIVIPSVVD